jgi:hypothetical protein
MLTMLSDRPVVEILAGGLPPNRPEQGTPGDAPDTTPPPPEGEEPGG